MVVYLSKIQLTFVLIVPYLSQGVGNFPIVTDATLLILGGFAVWLLNVVGRAHIDEEFHLMLFVSARYYLSTKTKLGLQLNQLHVLGELALSLHLL